MAHHRGSLHSEYSVTSGIWESGFLPLVQRVVGVSNNSKDWSVSSQSGHGEDFLKIGGQGGSQTFFLAGSRIDPLN